MASRGMGWIPDPRWVAPFGVASSIGPDGADSCFKHDALVRRGGDQGGTNTCVKWGYAGALWVLCGILGLPRQWLSVLGGYYCTRMLTLQGDKSKLADRGCRTADAADALRRQGWIRDDDWPFDARKVNEEPPMHALLRCSSRTWLRPKCVAAYGDDHGRAIRRALDAPGKEARPVLRASRVDKRYIQWCPGDMPWRLSGPVVGRHMELAVNYEPAGLHRVSSWGERFDRIESWESVGNDYEAESWVLDVDVAKFEEFIKGMP